MTSQESSSTPARAHQHREPPKEDRNVWIVTVYTISGLALFGVLAYYISTYLGK